MAQTPAPELIASIDVCKRLRIDRSTLSRWVQNGTATAAMRLGAGRGAFLFTPDEVDRLEAVMLSRGGAA